MQNPQPPYIRRATHDDSEGILHCLSSAFEPYRSQYTSAGFADTVLDRETLSARLRHMTIFIALDPQDNVIGTIACCKENETEGHLRGMAVSPEWQGRSVAEQLLSAAEHELRAAGCRRITLDTTAPLKRAVKFYRRMGFQETGRTADFFGMLLFEFAKDLDAVPLPGKQNVSFDAQ